MRQRANDNFARKCRFREEMPISQGNDNFVGKKYLLVKLVTFGGEINYFRGILNIFEVKHILGD